MNLKQLIPYHVKSVSIIGLSKNAGKTTVFNALTQTYRNQRILGIVSSGVDGEEYDVWSHRLKPRVHIPKGAFVVTAGSYLDEFPGNWELIQAMGQETMVGSLFLAQAKRDTVVKLIGVSSTSQLKRILHSFYEVGVDLALVDGAYDRKASASPRLTDGTILVVGASMDSSLERIKQKVKEVVHHFTLPVSIEQEAVSLALLEQKVIHIQDEEMEILPVSSLFQIKEFMQCIHKRKIKQLAIPGALTDRMLRALMDQRRYCTLIVPDATHLFISLPLVQQFIRKGGAIHVMVSIQLMGIAINPTSVEGYSFVPTVMKEEIERICPQFPVFDVVRGVHHDNSFKSVPKSSS